ncbi:MAG: hypothetical protein P8X76_12930 [Maritimibacter sp.]
MEISDLVSQAQSQPVMSVSPVRQAQGNGFQRIADAGAAGRVSARAPDAPRAMPAAHPNSGALLQSQLVDPSKLGPLQGEAQSGYHSARAALSPVD